MVVLVLFLPTVAAPADLCIPRGYTVGFFNGVWNTQAQAADGAVQLRWLLGTVFNSEPVRYEIFYNHTNGLQDIAEVFIQRSREIERQFANRLEYLWDIISGKRSWYQKILAVLPAAGAALTKLIEAAHARYVADVSRTFANPPTAVDSADHRARLDALALERQKLMLVAHSQGNLFLNPAYQYIEPKVTASSVKAVHIAPASPTLSGPHLLADIDIVINALRVQGFTTVPPVNISLPFSRDDVTGHQLAATYLDGVRPARAAVDGLIRTAMRALVAPSTTGDVGSFTVTLAWDGSGDVDLHTFEPTGSHVFYNNRRGAVGFLDVDNTIGHGPEHYFASCDSNTLQAGTYRIGINNFSSATGRTATVQISANRFGVLGTKTLGVGPERGRDGDGSPIPVFDVVVTKDPATGSVSFAVH